MDIALIKVGARANDGTGDDLRSANTKTNANNAAFKAAISDVQSAVKVAIDTANAAVASGYMKRVAAVAIPPLTAVVSQGDKIIPADTSNLAHLGQVLGIVASGVSLGNVALIQQLGDLTGLTTPFAAGDALYPAQGGGLTTAPPASGWLQIVAVAASSTRIVVTPSEASAIVDDGTPLVMADGGFAAQASLAEAADPTVTGKWIAPNALAPLVADARQKAALAGITDGDRPVARNPDWNWATLRSNAARYQLSNGAYDSTKLLPGGGEYGCPSIIAAMMTIPTDADANTDGSNPLLIICAPVSGAVVSYSNQAAAVALFGMARAARDQARLWGANLVTANWSTAGSQARQPFNVQMNGLEIDCGLDTPTSGWAGSNCDGIWMPAEHYGTAIDGQFNCLHTGIYGTIPWKNAWRLDHASCINVMEIGKASKAGQSNSMRFFMIARDAAGQDLFSTVFTDPSNALVYRPLNTSSLGQPSIKVQDAGGIDRVKLGSDGKVYVSSGAGPGYVEIGSTDGGANEERIRFKTAYSGNAASDKGLAEVAASPDSSGGRLVLRSAGKDGLMKEGGRLDSEQNLTLGRNTAPGGERLNVDGNIAPTTANTGTIGVSGRPWNTAYFQTQPTVGSDLRFKLLRGAAAIDEWSDDLPGGEFTDAELDAWGELRWRVYQMRDAVAAKGADKARYHYGLISQEVEAVCRRHDIDPARLALWLITPVYATRIEKRIARRAVVDVDGKPVIRTSPVLDADGRPQKTVVPTGEDAVAERYAVKQRERALFAQAAAEIGEPTEGDEDAQDRHRAILLRSDQLKAGDTELQRLQEALALRLASITQYIEIDVVTSEPEMEDIEEDIEVLVPTGETRQALRYESAFAIEAAWNRRQWDRAEHLRAEDTQAIAGLNATVKAVLNRLAVVEAGRA